MAVPVGWTMIRVRRGTAARLRALAENLVALTEAETIADPGVDPEPRNPACKGLSLDAVINLLIDARYSGRRRAKEQRAREKAARQAEAERAAGEDSGQGTSAT